MEKDLLLIVSLVKSFHENIRKGFLTLAEQEPNRFIVVNAEQSVDQVHQEIIEKIKGLIEW